MADEKKKKKTVPTPPVLPEGFAAKETAGDLDGEWVTPGVGTVIQGRLVKAFTYDGDNGLQAAYGVRDAAGDLWLFSERASYREAMRQQRLGSEIFLSFNEKVDILDKNEKKTGKSMWLTTMGSKDDGRGSLVAEELERFNKVATTQGKSADVPF